MFITFGCDGAVKLWAWGVNEPLIVLKTEENVIELFDACWSPSHATVVAACGLDKIFLWDVRRRTHRPISVYDTAYTCLNIEVNILVIPLLMSISFQRAVGSWLLGLGQGLLCFSV